MGFWKNIKRFRAKRLVREADSYLSDFHKRFAFSPEAAIAKCRKAIRLNPDDAEAYLVLANALNKEGTRDDAIEQYRRAIGLDPQLYWGHIHLAKALKLKAELAANAAKAEESRQFLEEAVSLFKRAFDIRKGDSINRADLGKALEALGEHDEAIAEFKDALKDDPDNSMLLYGLGLSLYNKGQYNEALAIYRRRVEKYPNSKSNHVEVGDALAALGHTEEALAEYRKAEFHVKAGELLLASGRHDEALKDFRISIQRDEAGKDWAYFHTGILLSEKEQKQEALEHLETFLKLVDQIAKDYAFSAVIKNKLEACDQAKRTIEALKK